MIALFLRAKTAFNLFLYVAFFRLIRIVTLKADLWDAVTESGISCVRIVDRTAMKINDPM